VVEPRHQAQGEHVLRALRLALGHVHLLERLERERRQRYLVDVVLLQRAVVERVGLVAGLLEVPLGEGVTVDDQGAALGQVAQVRLERRGVHRDEHVRRVAGSEDVVICEVELKAGDAGERAGGSANLGGEIG
jgi:hypothetical protein